MFLYFYVEILLEINKNHLLIILIKNLDEFMYLTFIHLFNLIFIIHIHNFKIQSIIHFPLHLLKGVQLFINLLKVMIFL